MAVVDGESVAAVRVEPERYPWHDPQWATLTRDLSRLPHALLFHGQSGLGKHEFALGFAQFLLCLDRGGGSACGRCRSCALFRVGNHPDLLRISPQEDSSNILVDQIRGVIEFLSLRPHTAAHKVVILVPAEAMNVNAANSLLKILEEPPAGSLLILVATHLARLPLTVRSRCTRVTFSVPENSEALAWLRARPTTSKDWQAILEQAGGGPLSALGYVEQGRAEEQAELEADFRMVGQRKLDPLACAERWKSMGVEIALEWLHRHVSTLIRSAVAEGKILSISIIDLFDFLDKVSIARRQLGTGADETLILENLMIQWCEIAASAD